MRPKRVSAHLRAGREMKKKTHIWQGCIRNIVFKFKPQILNDFFLSCVETHYPMYEQSEQAEMKCAHIILDVLRRLRFCRPIAIDHTAGYRSSNRYVHVCKCVCVKQAIIFDSESTFMVNTAIRNKKYRLCVSEWVRVCACAMCPLSPINHRNTQQRNIPYSKYAYARIFHSFVMWFVEIIMVIKQLKRWERNKQYMCEWECECVMRMWQHEKKWTKFDCSLVFWGKFYTRTRKFNLTKSHTQINNRY